METDLKVRKSAQDVMLFVCFKHRIILQEPSQELRFIPEITSQLMNNLCTTVRRQIFLNDVLWSGFFKKHFNRMTSSLELFTKYVSFVCYNVIVNNTNVLGCLLDTLTSVMYFVLRCWEAGSKEFLNTCVELICAFYEKELRTKFEDQRSWENLNTFLEQEIEGMDFEHFINVNACSFKEFRRQETKLVKNLQREMHLYISDLQKITRFEVETNEKVASLAESVANKMRDVCQKTFEELLADFAKTDRQVEDIYRKSVKVASSGLARKINYFSSRNVQEPSENILSTTKSPKSENTEVEKQMLKNSDSLNDRNSRVNFPKVDVLNKALSHLNLKSEKVGKLLREISMDILKLSVIIQSLCEEHGVQVPISMGTGNTS